MQASVEAPAELESQRTNLRLLLPSALCGILIGKGGLTIRSFSTVGLDSRSFCRCIGHKRSLRDADSIACWAFLTGQLHSLMVS